MRLAALRTVVLATALSLSVGAPLMPRPALAARVPDSFADLAARLLPAVVNISSTQKLETSNSGPEIPAFPPGSPFEQFFHDFMNRHQHPQGGDEDQQGNNQQPPGDDQGEQGDQGDQDRGDQGPGDQGPGSQAPGGTTPGPRQLQSLGSGFIVDPSGIVVTNNHVIAGADEITVTLQDNTSYKAKLLGRDERTDLAVLKIKPDHPLPAVQFGDVDKSRVGDWVLAIGNPFGLGGSVTAGIISARGRDIQQGPYDDFIQTDAPINRGNSGGPLFNMDGQVIGINTAIYSPSGGSIGIGFAIPSSMARLVVEQLRDYGHARRGWIGVRIQEVTPDIAESLGLKTPEGAMVAGVNQGGPAEKAHIQNGDVILAFNNEPVKEMRVLPRIVAETPIDQSVPVTIWRNGHQQVLQVTVAEQPDDAGAAHPPKPAPPPAPDDVATLADLGMKIAPITDASRQKYRLSAGQKGVVVTDVTPDGIAADRGLRPGDVIVEVQQQAVNTPAEVQQRLAEARRQSRNTALLWVQGQDGTRYVPLPLAGAKQGAPG